MVDAKAPSITEEGKAPTYGNEEEMALFDMLQASFTKFVDEEQHQMAQRIAAYTEQESRELEKTRKRALSDRDALWCKIKAYLNERNHKSNHHSSHNGTNSNIIYSAASSSSSQSGNAFKSSVNRGKKGKKTLQRMASQSPSNSNIGSDMGFSGKQTLVVNSPTKHYRSQTPEDSMRIEPTPSPPPSQKSSPLFSARKPAPPLGSPTQSGASQQQQQQQIWARSTKPSQYTAKNSKDKVSLNDISEIPTNNNNNNNNSNNGSGDGDDNNENYSGGGVFKLDDEDDYESDSNVITNADFYDPLINDDNVTMENDDDDEDDINTTANNNDNDNNDDDDDLCFIGEDEINPKSGGKGNTNPNETPILKAGEKDYGKGTSATMDVETDTTNTNTNTNNNNDDDDDDDDYEDYAAFAMPPNGEFKGMVIGVGGIGAGGAGVSSGAGRSRLNNSNIRFRKEHVYGIQGVDGQSQLSSSLPIPIRGNTAFSGFVGITGGSGSGSGSSGSSGSGSFRYKRQQQQQQQQQHSNGSGSVHHQQHHQHHHLQQQQQQQQQQQHQFFYPQYGYQQRSYGYNNNSSSSGNGNYSSSSNSSSNNNRRRNGNGNRICSTSFSGDGLEVIYDNSDDNDVSSSFKVPLSLNKNTRAFLYI